MARSRTKRFSMPVGDKRREPREVVTDGTIRISGETYPLRDWSRNGFQAMPCTAEVEPDDEVEITVLVPLPGGRLEFNCAAVVVRVNKEQEEVAGTFVEVDGKTRAIIDRHFGVDSARIWNILDGTRKAGCGKSAVFGSMSGERKRNDAERPKPPRLSSTPLQAFRVAQRPG